MYQIIGGKLALTWFALLCAAVIVVWAVWQPPHDPSSLGEWWKIASTVVSAAGLIVAILGQTKLFEFICRAPLIKTWFPAISGEWTATLASNWPAIQERTQPGGPSVPLAPVTAKVTIIARLFFIRINLVSDDRYSTSKTLFVRASRDPEDGSVTLHYIYWNTTKVPKATDSDSHDGAAALTLENQGDELWLEGVYWTNRNWHQGLNTAGKITLRRASRSASNVR
jgi:hypothetical protein